MKQTNKHTNKTGTNSYREQTHGHQMGGSLKGWVKKAKGIKNYRLLVIKTITAWS